MLDVDVSPDARWIYVGTWNGLWRLPTPEATLASLGAGTPRAPDGSGPPDVDEPPPATPPPSTNGASPEQGTPWPTLAALCTLATAAGLAARRR